MSRSGPTCWTRTRVKASTPHRYVAQLRRHFLGTRRDDPRVPGQRAVGPDGTAVTFAMTVLPATIADQSNLESSGEETYQPLKDTVVDELEHPGGQQHVTVSASV